MFTEIAIPLPKGITPEIIEDDDLFEIMEEQEILTLEPSWQFRGNALIIEPCEPEICPASKDEALALIDHFKAGLEKAYG